MSQNHWGFNLVLFRFLLQLLRWVLEFAGYLRLAETTAIHTCIIIIPVFQCLRRVTNTMQIHLAFYLVVTLLGNGSGWAAFNTGVTVNPYVEQAV